MPDTGCLSDVWGGKKYWLVVLKKKLQDLKLVHRSKTTPGHWVRVVWQVLGIGGTIRSCYLSLSTITTAHYLLSLIRFLELLFLRETALRWVFFVTFNSHHLTLHVQIISSCSLQ